MKYKIVKVNQEYKILIKEFFSWLDWFKEPVYLKDRKRRYSDLTSDLVFKDKACAELYLLKDYKQKNSTANRIWAGTCQLKEIFEHANIQPKSYRWADCWSGSGIWSLVLSNFIPSEILYVDICFRHELKYGLEEEVTSHPKIKIINLDTNKDRLPIEINAIFLRSTLDSENMIRIMELNPQVEVFIMIPEGLNDNSSLIEYFKKSTSSYQKYYKNVDIRNLESDLGLFGASSCGIKFNQDFPVIICQGRK